MKYTFIANPRSGKGRSNSIENLLNKYRDFYDINFFYTEYQGHAAELANAAVKQNIQNIIAVGGDGTMNEVASQLVGTESVFGLIPLGSGNGFARSLNLSLNPAKALETVFKGKTTSIDVGKVNEYYFFAVAGVGLDACIGNRFQSNINRGALPYFYLGFKEYINYSYPQYNIQIDAKNLKLNPMLVTIANATQFGNGALIAPHANMRDGYLDLCILKRMSLYKSLATVSKLFNGRINDLKEYESYKIKNAIISGETEEYLFHTDGEPHKSHNELKIEIIPDSLSVIIP